MGGSVFFYAFARLYSVYRQHGLAREVQGFSVRVGRIGKFVNRFDRLDQFNGFVRQCNVISFDRKQYSGRI